jgi:hypothetical protein
VTEGVGPSEKVIVVLSWVAVTVPVVISVVV